MAKKIRIELSLILLLFSFFGFSQLPDNKVVLLSGDTIEIKPLVQSEITPAGEAVNKRISEIMEYLNITDKLKITDSIIDVKTALLGNERDEVLKNLDDYSQREIENLVIKWKRYINELKTIQNSTSEISKMLEQDMEYVKVTQKTWKLTYDKFKAENGPEETIKWINDIIQKVKKIQKEIKLVQNKNFKVQNRLANLINLSEDVSLKLTKAQLNWTSQYFVRDSPPLWHLSDTLRAEKAREIHLLENFRKNIQSVWNYFVNNPGDIVVLSIIFLLLLSFFYFSYKKLLEREAGDEKTSTQKFIFSHYISSALILTIMANTWLSPDRPVMVTQFLVIILLFPSFIIFSNRVSRKLRPYILIVVIIFLIDELQIFLDIPNVFSRLVYLVKIGIVLWLFLLIANPKGLIQRELKEKWWGLAFKLVYLFAFLVFISGISNIIGYVNLSVLLLRATVSSLLFGIILSIVVTLLLNSFEYAFSTKALLSVNMINNHLELIKKRTRQIIIIYFTFLWFKITFNSFGLWQPIVIWLSDALKTNWELGPVTISFEGIITFFLVLIVTFALSKIVKVILKEEVFPRVVLPRGVPGAITKVASYLIIAYGLYVALESAGVDFKQFGLIAGALGVGIGFGLQNIVANFISGLILSFERPIQAGDTIEVGNLMGEVKDIGVRASTVRTFDGAEVIVPNSNLISNDVINWTLSDRRRRRIVHIGTAYGTDPHKVLDLLFEVASNHPSVLKNPKPWVTFDGFGESSLNFTVRFWTTLDTGLTVQSQVAMDIYDAINDAGIEIPFPQHDLHIKSWDPTVQTTVYPWSSKDGGKQSGRKTSSDKKEDSKDNQKS